MAGLKARLLGGWIGDRVLRDAAIAEVADVAPGFRRITIAGESFRGVACTPGDKVQVYLPDVGARTYTPFAYEPVAGRFQILAYLHGSGPGALWARGLAPGDGVRVLGPRSSLDLPALPGPVALFGDETSMGIARALLDSRRAADVRIRLEVSSIAEASKAAEALGLPAGSLVAREAGRRHLSRVARELVAGAPESALVLTGDAHSIQAVRGELRPLSAKPARARAYWAEGKRGLD